MKEDIIADDAIISTDVDNLVKILSKEKKIELNELARMANMPKGEVEKWLQILEEEGYIKLTYNLTRVYASWAGENESSIAYEKEENEKQIEKKVQEEYNETFENEINNEPEKLEKSDDEIDYEFKFDEEKIDNEPDEKLVEEITRPHIQNEIDEEKIE